MAVFISLEKAIHQMDSGDIFKPKSSAYTELYMMDDKSIARTSDNVHIRLSVCNLGIMGEITPAEPKVLTINEIRRNCADKYSEIPMDASEWEDKLMLKSDKNGQLKESIRLKPFFDEVDKYLEWTKGCHNVEIVALREAREKSKHEAS